MYGTDVERWKRMYKANFRDSIEEDGDSFTGCLYKAYLDVNHNIDRLEKVLATFNARKEALDQIREETEQKILSKH